MKQTKSNQRQFRRDVRVLLTSCRAANTPKHPLHSNLDWGHIGAYMTRAGETKLFGFLYALNNREEHELIPYQDRFYDERVALVVWGLLREHCSRGWMRSELQSLELEAQMAQL
jgi:hypothetical protein